jgi:hypothetical protein
MSSSSNEEEQLVPDMTRRLRRFLDGKPEVRFRCNLCGFWSWCSPDDLDREAASCKQCGSNVRWRTIVAALSKALFGRGLAIPDFPNRPDIKGIGLSDQPCYATPLAAKLGYLNTFYDRAPQFDIMNVGPEHDGQYDFILSTEVFEHVAPPPIVAFESSYRMLRPGGILVFSVPYHLEGQTTEHFPDLFNYRLERTGDDYVLHNETKDGRREEFRDLVFHGGPGFTLEMRVFSLQGIRDCVEQAGFESLQICGEDDWQFGIYTKGITWSLVMVATK